MTDKVAVVAVGGNSLIEDPQRPQIEYQWAAVHETCDHIAQMIADGWQVAVTHGNGPQVGYMLHRTEIAAAHGIHEIPLDMIVADTQGSIGYMLQQALDNALRRYGINRRVITVITQVLVDRHDPAFVQPTKPVGGFMSEAEAIRRQESGWQVVEDAGRGWRRVVASPQPCMIQEVDAISSLLDDYVVIACGGGGIPVVRDQYGDLCGVEAVIDKDRASSLLAAELLADLFIISTGVEKVSVNFNRADQRDLTELTVTLAEQYMAEGQFPPGSMGPKIEAAVNFIRSGGPQAVITDPPNLARALRGETGTRVIPG